MHIRGVNFCLGSLRLRKKQCICPTHVESSPPEESYVSPRSPVRVTEASPRHTWRSAEKGARAQPVVRGSRVAFTRRTSQHLEQGFALGRFSRAGWEQAILLQGCRLEVPSCPGSDRMPWEMKRWFLRFGWVSESSPGQLKSALLRGPNG